MIMRNKICKNVQFPSFMLNNEMLLEAKFVKYLGNLILNSMQDNCNMSRQCRQLYAQDKMCSNDVKKTLFTTFCSPMCTVHLCILPPVYTAHLCTLHTSVHCPLCTLPTYVYCPPVYTAHLCTLLTCVCCPLCTLPTCVHCPPV